MSRVFTYTELPELYIRAKGTSEERKFHCGGTGFYAHPNKNGKVRKICRTLQTALDVLEMFPNHYDELIQMYNYKMEDLIDPILWQNRI